MAPAAWLRLNFHSAQLQPRVAERFGLFFILFFISIYFIVYISLFSSYLKALSAPPKQPQSQKMTILEFFSALRDKAAPKMRQGVTLGLRISGMVEEWGELSTGIISQRFLQVKYKNLWFWFSISRPGLEFWVVTSHRSCFRNKVQLPEFWNSTFSREYEHKQSGTRGAPGSG